MITHLKAVPADDADGEGWDYFDPDAGQIGCCNCDSGWRHGCCDDLCYASVAPVDCDAAIPCRFCNPNGEVAF